MDASLLDALCCHSNATRAPIANPPNRVINRWNALDQSAVDAPSINAFKQASVKVRNNRMGFFMDYSSEPYALLVDDWLVRPHMVSQ